jgi:hypothetical protein
MDRDQVAECGDTVSDPRVDGTYVDTYSSDCHWRCPAFADGE